MGKDITKSPVGRPPKIPPSQAALYAEMRTKYPMMAVKDLRRLCCYSAGHSPSETVQARAIDLDRERERIQNQLEYTFKDNIQVIKSIQDNQEENTADRINAVKTGNQMMGFNSAQEIKSTNKSLFIELQGLTIEQLKQLEQLSIDNENS